MSEANPDQVRKFYNVYARQQLGVGINLRHYMIINTIIQQGLSPDHRVLEIGCGVGTFTTLLSRYLRRGKVVAVDISDESIAIAREKLGHRRHVEFVVGDIDEIHLEGEFDMIVMPDVLEHIPVEKHAKMFAVLSRHLANAGVIIIHIPHPKMVDFNRAHHPEKLQVIDQALSAHRLLEDIEDSGLVLGSYSPYALFAEHEDYIFIVLKKDQSVRYHELGKSRIRLRKLMQRLKFMWHLVQRNL